MNIKIDHMNLTVRNLTESMEWYKNLFGMEFKEGDINDPKEPWAIIGKDDTMICMYEHPGLRLFAKEELTDIHKIFHFGVRISDKAEWEKKLKTITSLCFTEVLTFIRDHSRGTSRIPQDTK